MNHNHFHILQYWAY